MFGQTNVTGVTLPEASIMADEYSTLLMKGIITASLSSKNGESICTRDGQEIAVWGRFDAYRQEVEDNAVSRATSIMSDQLSKTVTEIVGGEVSAPLMTSGAQALATRNGEELAMRLVNAEPHSDNGLNSAVSLLFSVVDTYHLEYLRKTSELSAYIAELFTALDRHSTDAVKGIAFTGMAASNGAAIVSRSGQELAAWRSYVQALETALAAVSA